MVWLRRRYLVVDVVGSSMEPTFRPGQQVVARRVQGRRVRADDVVVVRDIDGIGPPGAPDVDDKLLRYAPCLIKRVVARSGDPVPRDLIPALRDVTEPVVPEGRIVLAGDNAVASYDSRKHGYYLEKQVIGKVVRPGRSVLGEEC
ncbi:S26 family signal peptidase [Actinomadura sp. NPDC047616]|uniref:S26 family signal peptidase n=1 Tax=Actinomadura sp. NPDC047616 TaxID=3155914 RepID=UPI0033CF53F7